MSAAVIINISFEWEGRFIRLSYKPIQNGFELLDHRELQVPS